MSTATDYLNSLLGASVEAKDGKPQITMLDSLFKNEGGAESYLDQLMSGATPEANKTAAATTTNATGQTDLSNVESVAAMARQNGWADPTNFNLNMLTTPDTEVRHTEGSSYYANPYVQFKDPESRGITNTGRNLNRVQLMYDDQGQNYGTEGSPITGYKVLAGAVPGTKNHTALYYQYDKDGKFQGANFDTEERGLQGAIPLVNMALMAAGFGGLSGTLGASANSALGLNLGATGQQILGNTIMGGTGAAATGQNVVKGALTGAASAGIGALNPAGMAGITNPTLAGAANGALSGGASALINGGDLAESMLTGSIHGAVGGATKKPNAAPRPNIPSVPNYWLPPANNRA